MFGHFTTLCMKGLMAIDTPILRNILSMISEPEVALIVKIFGSSYSQGMEEWDIITSFTDWSLEICFNIMKYIWRES